MAPRVIGIEHGDWSEADCRFFGERLHAYVEGELGDAESGFVASHLRACGACRGERDRLEAERIDLLEAFIAPLPSSIDVAGKIGESIRAEAELEAQGQRLSLARFLSGLAAGLVIGALGVLFAFTVGRGAGEAPEPLAARASAPPAVVAPTVAAPTSPGSPTTRPDETPDEIVHVDEPSGDAGDEASGAAQRPTVRATGLATIAPEKIIPIADVFELEKESTDDAGEDAESDVSNPCRDYNADGRVDHADRSLAFAGIYGSDSGFEYLTASRPSVAVPFDFDCAELCQ